MPASNAEIGRTLLHLLGLTMLRQQTVGATRYFDVAGYPGRTLGLPAAGLSTGSVSDD